MNVAKKISELNLPESSYIVVGSGILGALGIRESSDIDLVVTQEVYDHFESLGWEKGLWGNKVVFQKDMFDIGLDWYGETAQEVLKRAQVVNGVPYLSLDEVYEWKKRNGREKDLRDLILIDEYRATH